VYVIYSEAWPPLPLEGVAHTRDAITHVFERSNRYQQENALLFLCRSSLCITSPCLAGVPPCTQAMDYVQPVDPTAAVRR
jgi:hypothetical protein